jgi:hypothetical protein
VKRLAALACFALTLASGAAAQCRQSLILALDVSGSVDEVEYVLQLGGLAQALEDPAVQEALFSFPDAPVSLAIFEWSSGSYQRLILDWTAVGDPTALAAITARLRTWQRQPAPEATGLGAAMEYAADLRARGPVCWRSTIDISGDGKNNDWPIPREVLGRGILDGSTVNALVIGQEFTRRGRGRAEGVLELTAYFRANILYGPDAFLEVALGFEDYAKAMTRKLLRELSVPPLGQMTLPPEAVSRLARLATD